MPDALAVYKDSYCAGYSTIEVSHPYFNSRAGFPDGSMQQSL